VTSTALIDALPMLALCSALALGLAVFIAQPWWTERRRARLQATPFPAPWRRILRRHVPIVAKLPAELQLRLKRLIPVFVAEKTFIGCQGQAITDEVRITIAAQACLLLLGQPGAECYPQLRQILVYPDAFVADRTRPLGDGVVQERRHAMSGESWAQGQIILSWADVLTGAADPADGCNVVLHEFAHQIDQDKGVADGRPWRPQAKLRRRWAAVMGEAFERLQREPSAVIDAYGATDPAEFFAVVTEVFFEAPQALGAEAPQVYGELAELYRVNPAQW
jgi:Mlc titration factor MtfA (ptsG expression regulator)